MKWVSFVYCYLVSLHCASARHRLMNFDQGRWLQQKHLRSQPSRKTAILCHGCHLQSESWEDVIWGTSDNIGRIPRSVQLAIEENASLLVFGSGGSFTHTGLTEGEYTLQYLKRNLSKLLSFKNILKLDKNLNDITTLLKEITVCETESVNTVEELEHACSFFSQYDIEKVIIVSSPTHLSRCIRDAVQVFERMGYSPLLQAIPSQTCYANSTVADVCIVEPAHRGDRDKRFDGELSYHRLFTRVMALHPSKRFNFANELLRLLMKHEDDMEDRE